MHGLFCTFFPVSAVQKLLKSLRFDGVAITCTLLRFRNHGKNVGFDMMNFIIVTCRISSRLK